jgi:hypothetical protein
MKKITKTYQSIADFELHTNINVKGVPVRVAFEGGTKSPYATNGTFTTNSSDLQLALEKDTGFNKTFKLIHTDGPEIPEGPEGPEGPENPEEKPELPEEKLELPEEKPELPEKPADVYDSVVNVQQAKEILLTYEGVKTRDVLNRAMVLEVAKEKNVVFPNLK